MAPLTIATRTMTPRLLAVTNVHIHHNLTSAGVEVHGLAVGLPILGADAPGEVGVPGADPPAASPPFKRAFISDLAIRSLSAAPENIPARYGRNLLCSATST